MENEFSAALHPTQYGNARMTVYWIAAGVLTLDLTYL